LAQNTKTWKNIPNYRELYQMSIKYNKRPQNGPSVQKIYQHLPVQDPPKFTQIWILVWKQTIWQPCTTMPSWVEAINSFGSNFMKRIWWYLRLKLFRWIDSRSRFKFQLNLLNVKLQHWVSCITDCFSK
jgi:hypothetical protein